MAPGEPCKCDRSVIERTLEAMLSMLVRSMEGLNSLVTEHAEEMGLDSLGVFDERPEGATVLAFPLNSRMRIKWDEVDAQLAAIGKPTGMFTVPREMLMGIRGDQGDLMVRLIDVQQHRLNGVLEYLKDTPIIPPWFDVEAKIRLKGSASVYEVVSIDTAHRSWVGSLDGDQGAYPLNEVATRWEPV